MDKIIEYIKQAERIIDQADIGKDRVLKNVAFFKRLLEAMRQEDLGPDTNSLLDELIVLANKILQFGIAST